LTRSPLSNKKFRNLFIVCWLVWAVLQVQVLTWCGYPVVPSIIDSAITNALLVGSCLLIASILRYYLPQPHRYSFILGLCAITTVLWFFISRGLLFIALHNQPLFRMFFSEAAVVRIAIAFLIIGCMTLVCVLWYSLADQRETERRRRDAEQLAKETELYKLRQQLQPHFLFNSLNSINALVTLHPAMARTMIQQLSDFLRGTIKREENTWTPLEEEFQQLRLYLDIEKVRFGHRLQTEIVNGVAEHKAFMPAMLLQPVVENAIKFGLYDTTGDVTIAIRTAMENNDLIIEVRNPFDAETNASNRGTGFGLKSVQRRLYLLFARADLLQTNTDGGQFITTIKIPQRDHSHHH
jgi:two-component system, LytTR family, sensor kinase